MRALLFGFILLAACKQDPMQVEIREGWDQDAEVKEAIESLEGEDRKLLSRYLFRMALNERRGEQVEPVTLGEALDAQRKFQVEVEAKQALRDAERELKRKHRELVRTMRDSFLVQSRGIGFQALDGEVDSFVLRLDLRNVGDRSLESVTVALSFMDRATDKEIKHADVTISPNLGPGEVHAWEGTMPFLPALDGDQQLRRIVESGNLDSLGFRWKPVAVSYVGGTRLSTK